MPYPNVSDYNSSINNFNKLVHVPLIRNGRPQRTKDNSRFLAYTGGYSVVYKVGANNSMYALRCWLSDISNSKERYRKISEFLSQIKSKYFVYFDYIDNGISATVGGTSLQKFPVICMDWAPGETLNNYIDKNINQPSKIKGLADEFLAMVTFFHDNHISHGDLQDGNILVDNTGQLRVIDYDSLYVPSLKGFKNEIFGVPAYQSPHRSKKTFASEKIDYFSELVIYLSISVYVEAPYFWRRVNGKHTQDLCMLFQDEDLRNPSSPSSIFSKLSTLSPQVVSLADTLKNYCQEPDIYKLSPLEKVLDISPSKPQRVGAGSSISTTPTNKPQYTPPLVIPKKQPMHTSTSTTSSSFIQTSLSNVILCVNCNRRVTSTDIYCPNCHKPSFGNRNAPCGHLIPYKSTYCPKCRKKTGW